MKPSLQSNAIKSLGGFGGQRVTGESLITGEFMAIKGVGETTILGQTEGNIENISGLVLPSESVLLGEWTVVHTTGDCIVYNG